MTTTSSNISISGLRAATKDMEVVSNNIANADTVGFKKSRSNFADIYANGLMSSNMGVGVTISSVQQLFTDGSIQLTGRTLDLSINSDSFFQLRDPVSGVISYTRAGNFQTDQNGYVVTPTGQRVQGYIYVNGVKTGAIGDIQIPTGNQPASATTNVSANVNLDASSAVPSSTFSISDPTSYNFTNTTTVYDSLGTSHNLTMYFRKTAANTWSLYESLDGGAANAAQTLTFNSSGALTTAMPLSAANNSFALTNGATTPLAFTVNFTGSTQYGSTSLVNSSAQNGYPSGMLSGLTIDNQGIFSAQYSNNEVNPIAQVALANFAAPEQLQPVSNNQWLATADSGPALVQGSNPPGTIQSGALEASNVDTTQELVTLLQDQRLYQANAKAVQISEATLDAILNIV